MYYSGNLKRGVKMNLGKSLAIAIAQKQIKNKDLAEAMGVKTQQVTNWKGSGAIKQSYLEKICEYFDMKVSEFIELGED